MVHVVIECPLTIKYLHLFCWCKLIIVVLVLPHRLFFKIRVNLDFLFRYFMEKEIKFHIPILRMPQIFQKNLYLFCWCNTAHNCSFGVATQAVFQNSSQFRVAEGYMFFCSFAQFANNLSENHQTVVYIGSYEKEIHKIRNWEGVHWFWGETMSS